MSKAHNSQIVGEKKTDSISVCGNPETFFWEAKLVTASNQRGGKGNGITWEWLLGFRGARKAGM